MRRTSLLPALLLALALLTGCQGDDGDELDPGARTKQRTAPAGDLTYVALGDSYSSAPGVPETDPGNPCLRSTSNYPSQVADQLRASTFVDVTCGGATTRHMTTAQHAGVPPQLDALTRDTDLVTLGIGGNDSQVFFTAIYQCTMIAGEDPSGSPCQDAADKDPGKAESVLEETEQRIVGVVEEIERRAPKAEVMLVGYPQLVPAEGTCPELPLAEGDYPYAREVNMRLTEAVEGAAERTEATYIDMWAASEGHDVCADKPWVNGAENNARAAAYHPFVEEQEAAAGLVVEAFRQQKK